MIAKEITANKEAIKDWVANSSGLTFRHIDVSLGKNRTVECMLVFIHCLVDEQIINQFIVAPLSGGFLTAESINADMIKQHIYCKQFTEITHMRDAIDSILKGSSVLFVNGSTSAFRMETAKTLNRDVEEPPAEIIVKGPREGFIEDISVNEALLRKRLPHAKLKFEELTLGTYSRTKVMVSYIEGIAKKELVAEVKRRLNSIRIDNVPSAGEIEQLINDSPSSIFPTFGNTQRPDKTAALLVEGRIAIMVDSTPVVLFAPHLFFETIQSPEDYNNHYYYASFIRLLRFSGLLFSVLLPSFYIASMNFQKEMIPSALITSLIEAREKVPFPLALEVILMVLLFETVREAGIRLPKSFGQAVSIVGALILGDVSISAGLVGAPTIVIISISFIVAFVITPLSEVITLLRLLLFIPTILFGVYGLIIGSLIILIHLVSLTSLGVPYMAPLAPTYFADWKDFFVRMPIRWFKNRPISIPSSKKVRLSSYPKLKDRD